MHPHASVLVLLHLPICLAMDAFAHWKGMLGGEHIKTFAALAFLAYLLLPRETLG